MCCKDTLLFCNYQIIREENNIKHIISVSVCILTISQKGCKQHDTVCSPYLYHHNTSH